MNDKHRPETNQFKKWVGRCTQMHHKEYYINAINFIHHTSINIYTSIYKQLI